MASRFSLDVCYGLGHLIAVLRLQSEYYMEL